jgi:hypothetical protein
MKKEVLIGLIASFLGILLIELKAFYILNFEDLLNPFYFFIRFYDLSEHIMLIFPILTIIGVLLIQKNKKLGLWISLSSSIICSLFFGPIYYIVLFVILISSLLILIKEDSMIKSKFKDPFLWIIISSILFMSGLILNSLLISYIILSSFGNVGKDFYIILIQLIVSYLSGLLLMLILPLFYKKNKKLFGIGIIIAGIITLFPLIILSSAININSFFGVLYLIVNLAPPILLGAIGIKLRKKQYPLTKFKKAIFISLLVIFFLTIISYILPSFIHSVFKAQIDKRSADSYAAFKKESEKPFYTNFTFSNYTNPNYEIDNINDNLFYNQHYYCQDVDHIFSSNTENYQNCIKSYETMIKTPQGCKDICGSYCMHNTYGEFSVNSSNLNNNICECLCTINPPQIVSNGSSNKIHILSLPN